MAELPKVATGIILKSELNQAATFRGRKLRGVGQDEVVWTKALKSGPSGANGQVTEVTVQACLDSSKATAVDATGKSVKKPGTATRWLDEMQMRFVEGAWKAYYGMNEAAQVLIKLACVALALMTSALVVPAAADPIRLHPQLRQCCRRNISTGECELNLESSKPVTRD